MIEDEREVLEFKKIIEKLYLVKIREVYGENAISITEELTDSISNIFQHIKRNIIQELYILKSLTERPVLSDYQTLTSFESTVGLSGNRIFIEIINENELHYKIDVDDSPIDYTSQSILYYKNPSSEFFFLEGSQYQIQGLNSSDTIFIKPTFKSLDKALDNYKINQCRNSNCLILKEKVWEGGIDSNRVVFVQRPEHIMRDSLYNFLNANLRGNKEVLREQNVNEKNPIDIKVIWNYTNHVALIEIKWTGLSSTGFGFENNEATRRVNKGARQLANYLELYKTESPGKNTVGYLVIYDGRRKDVSKEDTTVNMENSSYYRNREFEFTPKYDEIRSDFSKPIRFFMEAKVV